MISNDLPVVQYEGAPDRHHFLPGLRAADRSSNLPQPTLRRTIPERYQVNIPPLTFDIFIRS